VLGGRGRKYVRKGGEPGGIIRHFAPAEKMAKGTPRRKEVWVYPGTDRSDLGKKRTIVRFRNEGGGGEGKDAVTVAEKRCVKAGGRLKKIAG